MELPTYIVAYILKYTEYVNKCTMYWNLNNSKLIFIITILVKSAT